MIVHKPHALQSSLLVLTSTQLKKHKISLLSHADASCHGYKFPRYTLSALLQTSLLIKASTLNFSPMYSFPTKYSNRLYMLSASSSDIVSG